jgi:hypothetical protein
MGLSIHSIYRLLQPGLRRRRIQLLLDGLKPQSSTRILDVGGYAANWDGVPIDSPVTCLNLQAPTTRLPERFTCCVGDGRYLPFANDSFDLVFSNSVIEHLTTYENQGRFAAEIRRVGKQLFVQTPNRWFFIEPHFLTIFVHFLPRPIAKRVIRFASLRAWLRNGDTINLRQLADEVRLLSFREMLALFPDCEIHRETWCGLTKSFIAIRR